LPEFESFFISRLFQRGTQEIYSSQIREISKATLPNCAYESEALLPLFETDHLKKIEKSTTIFSQGKLAPELRALSSAMKHLFDLDQFC